MGAAKHRREAASSVKGSEGLTVLALILPHPHSESEKGAMMGEATPLWSTFMQSPLPLCSAPPSMVRGLHFYGNVEGERRCAGEGRLVIMNQASEWSSSRRGRHREQVPPPPA